MRFFTRKVLASLLVGILTLSVVGTASASTVENTAPQVTTTQSSGGDRQPHSRLQLNLTSYRVPLLTTMENRWRE